MADIKLTRPAAGQNIVVPSAPDARMVLDFAADQVSIDRPQGSDSLYFRFDDGSSIELQNFYTQYNKDAIPSFEVDGQLIAGADFFNAFGPDLAPAAGPAASPTRGGGYQDYTNAGLADGLNHLNGLDLQLNGGAAGQGAQFTTGTPLLATAGATVDYGVTLIPFTPPKVTPDTPNVPVQNGPDYPSTLPYDMMNVSESGLPGGSGQQGAGVSASGGMTISAPDGLSTIVINGATVWQGGKLVTNEVNVPNGKLEGIAYDTATGKLTYTYTLTEADHHNVQDKVGTDDQVAHEVLVRVTDSDGDVGQGVIRVEVGDDGPVVSTVIDHSNAVAVNYGADHANYVETTAVYEAVKLVAYEGKEASSGKEIAWSGHGTDLSSLSSDSYWDSTDGNIRVTNNNGTLTFALAENGKSVDMYVQATDTDGDTAGNALHLHSPTIGTDSDADTPGAQITGVSVNESQLSHGSANVSSDNHATASGTFTVDTHGEGGSIKIGDTVYTLDTSGNVTNLTSSGANANNVIITSDGTLTITGISGGTVEYTYTLTGAQTHSVQGQDSVTDKIIIVVEDATGDKSTGTLSVNIVDDVPTANNDTLNLGERDAQGVSTGNVLGNDVSGADLPKSVVSIGTSGDSQRDVASSGNTGTVVVGQYGTLTIKADGSYTYQLNDGVNVDPGVTVTDSFTYTMKDGDGDTSTANISVNVVGDTHSPHLVTNLFGVSNLVWESGLPDGTHAGSHGETTSGFFLVGLNGEKGTITVSEGEHSLTLTLNAAGQVVGWSNDSHSITTGVGTLTITGVDKYGAVHYDYTLTSAPTNDADHNLATTDSIKVTVVDQTHDEASDHLNILIMDDRPYATLDKFAVGELNAQTGASDGGNVLDNDMFGADTSGAGITGVAGGISLSAVTGHVGSEVAGRYGVLTLKSDGTYSYKLNANVDVPNGKTYSDVFTYTITDGDGDTSTASVIIKVQGDTNVPEVHTPSAGGASTTVYESALSDGTHTVGSTSTSGEISLVLNHESARVKIGGATFTLDTNGDATNLVTTGAHANNTIDTGAGMLTISGIAGGKISYTYTLDEAQKHPSQGADSVTDNIAIVVTDSTGDKGTGTLSVAIVDDVPTVSVVQGHSNEASVNFGADNGNYPGTDVEAAVKLVAYEGSSATANHTISWVGHGSDLSQLSTDSSWVSTDGNIKVTNNNGTLTFALANNGRSVDVYVQATDADGDTAGSTLNLHAPTISLVGSAVRVEESLFPHGTENPSNSNLAVASGTFTVDTHGEGGKVVIGGVEFSLTANDGANGLVTSGPNANNTIDTGEGTLAVTSIINGTVSYTYTLNAAQTHADGQGNNTLIDAIGITVIDQTNDTATSSLGITIVDDVPKFTSVTTAVPNSLPNLEGTVAFSAGHNGSAQIVSSATPPPFVFGTEDGSGLVHLSTATAIFASNDGAITSFTSADSGKFYVSNNALGIIDSSTDRTLPGAGGNHTSGRYAEFGYNEDAHTSEALVVDLPDNTEASSITLSLSSFYSGTGEATELLMVRFYNGASYQDVEVSAQNSSGNLTTTVNCTLPGGFDKAYILPKWTGNANQSDDSDFSLNSIQLGGVHNSLASYTGTVHAVSADGIIDYRFGAIDPVPTATGNIVFTLSPDGHSITGVREGITLFSATIDPKTGTWVSQQSGTFEVDDHGAAGNSLMLKIVAEDKDHDTTSTDTKVDCTLPATPTVQGLTVLEHGLTSDADHSESAVFEVPAGYTVVGATHTDPDHSNVTVSDGICTYNLTHATMEGTDPKDSVTLTLQDSYGNKFTVPVSVKVVDDVPTIDAHIDHGTVAAGSTVNGKVNIAWGADGPAAADSITVNGVAGEPVTNGLAFHLTNGTLLLGSQGAYTFTANANTNATQTFTFAVTDADGDKSTSVVGVTICKPAAPAFTHDINVDEAGLANGTAASTSVETATWTAPDGYTITQVTGNGSSAIGTVSQTDSTHVSYTLSQGVLVPGNGTNIANNADTMTVTLKDAHGNTYDVTVNVDVKDDVPKIDAHIDQGKVPAGSSVSGTVNITWGADGPATANSITVNGVAGKSVADGLEFHLNHGTLLLDSQGKYTFTADANTNAKQTFTFAATDADGDKVTSDVKVTISKPAAPTVTTDINVDEAGLANGTAASTSVETATWTAPEGYTITGVTTGGVGTATIDPIGSKQLSYTLGHNLLIPGTDNNTVPGGDHMTVTLQDAHGNTYNVAVNVDVVDDVPTLGVVDSIDHLIAGQSYTSHQGDFSFAQGADGATLYVSINNESDTHPVSFDSNHQATITTTHGTLTLDSQSGTYSYVAKSSATAGTDTFRFTATDGDGDTAKASLDVSVVNSGTKLLVGGNDGTSLHGSADYAANIIAGDLGGTDNHTVIVPGQTYNISIILDLSVSMKYNLESGTGSIWGKNPAGTRMEMAVKTLENFFKNSIQEHDGTVHLHLVGFGTNVLGSIDVNILANSTVQQRNDAYNSFAHQLQYWKDSMFAGYYEEATNYQAALDNATKWYNNTTGVTNNGGVNMAYFITDGEPSTCNNANKQNSGGITDSVDVTSALTSFGELTKAGVTGVKVNAIGIGNISDQGQAILNMLDNTTANGTLTSTSTYPYQDSHGRWLTATGNTRYAVGDSDLINTADGLTAALEKGATYSYQGLISVGNDTISGGSSDYVFGDALNTDGLIHVLGLESVLHPGSGYAVFQYLEAHHDINMSSLFPTDPHHVWTSADTTNYITTHYEQMGWETKVLTTTDGAGHQTSTFYLADLEGNIHNLDGSTTSAHTLDDLTGRTGGNDSILGGGEADYLFGQEGNDTIHGDAGNDYIYGGSGHDVLYGDAGDDFLFGGSGNDHLYGGDGSDHLYGGAGNDFLDGGTSHYDAITNPTGGNVLDGGAGNDILVFHKGDTIDGGSGIDVLLTNDSTNDLSSLLQSTHNVEVAIKGMNAAHTDDPLSLTDLSKLTAVDINITDSTVNGHTVTTMTLDATKWTDSGDHHTFTNASASLTLNTNMTETATHDNTEVVKFVLQNG